MSEARKMKLFDGWIFFYFTAQQPCLHYFGGYAPLYYTLRWSSGFLGSIPLLGKH